MCRRNTYFFLLISHRVPSFSLKVNAQNFKKEKCRDIINTLLQQDVPVSENRTLVCRIWTYAYNIDDNYSFLRKALQFLSKLFPLYSLNKGKGNDIIKRQLISDDNQRLQRQLFTIRKKIISNFQALSQKLWKVTTSFNIIYENDQQDATV
jgi:hypothetical protein